MNFARLTEAVSHAAGHPGTVAASVLLVVVWALVGPYYEWSEAHQLFINTATTIITFWLCFVIQSTQNKDTLALHAKLDEIILALDKANNNFIGLEDRTEKEIRSIREQELVSNAETKPNL